MLLAEPLRLACDALQALLALSPFAGVADLAMEKLCYQAIARGVDLGEFGLGLRAAAFLQMCLRQRDSGTPGATTPRNDGTPSAAGSATDGPHAQLYLTLDEGEGGSRLRLCSFAPPGTNANESVDVAKLVSGASLNACRCCLEVGSREALGLMVGALGRSAGVWIKRVGELGEAAKAGEYGWRKCAGYSRCGMSRRYYITRLPVQKCTSYISNQLGNIIWVLCWEPNKFNRGRTIEHILVDN